MHTMRRGLMSLLAATVFLQSACSVPVRPDNLAQRDRSGLGRVAVAAAGFTPSYEFQALTTGKGDAAAKGAGAGALHCGELLKGGGNGVAALVFLICLPVGAAVGAIHGASAAASNQEVDTAKARLQGAIAALRLQRQTAQKALAYGATVGLTLRDAGSAGPVTADDTPRYEDLRAVADAVVEVAIHRIEVVSTGAREQQAVIRVEAHVRVVDTRDGRPLDSLLVKELSSFRPVEEWLRNDGAAIGEALETATASIAEQAIDEIFLVYHPAALREETPPESGATEKQRVPPYALRAIQPPIRNKVYLNERMTYGHLERYPLDSLLPSFRWEAWPRGFDVTPGDEPGQARHVRYDFRLFSSDGIAYEWFGLTAPEHTVGTPLRPCESYRWTVRARFTLNGAPRATEWTGAYDTMGGPVAPWWWRRGSGVPPLYVVPGSVRAFYPIVETPDTYGGACPGR